MDGGGYRRPFCYAIGGRKQFIVCQGREIVGFERSIETAALAKRGLLAEVRSVMSNEERKYADGMTPDLHPAQIAAYRRMSPQDKFRAFGRLYWQARQLKMSWLRHTHPGWTEEEVEEETRRIFLNANTG